MLPISNLQSNQTIRLNIDSNDILVLNHPIDVVEKLSKWKNWPWITILLNLSIWMSYLIGMAVGPEKYNKSSVIFPSNPQWFFYEVVSWPYCQDVRIQVWRRISYLFVHDGFMHIFGNSICFIVYGSFLEIFHPMSSILVFFTFFLSGVSGAMGYSILWPYTGLIGASPGVYGLLGGCIVLMFWFRNLMHFTIQFVLTFILLFQICYDILNYLLYYSTNIGYSAHLYGLISGILCTLIFLGFLHHKVYSVVVSISSIFLLGLIIGYSIYNEVFNFPPIPYENSFAHNNDPEQLCCYEFMTFLKNHPNYNIDELRKKSTCSNHGLIIFH